MNINELWHSKDEANWEEALKLYWNYVMPKNRGLEEYFCYQIQSDLDSIIGMSGLDFYEFLYNKYFPWKYTAANRLATTRNNLRKYAEDNEYDRLLNIKNQLFNFDIENISDGLKITQQIKGLGIAGAPGLLSVLFPNHFGTVDQFVVFALLEINDFPFHDQLKKINPQGINLKQGSFLTSIMREKANKLNLLFESEDWTPRKIDMILWSIRE